MVFSSDILSYLTGEKFSSGISVRLSNSKTKIYNRLDLLTELCSKKSVVHVGFADHLELIEPKIQKNQWLHKRIMDVSSQCIGVDLNEEAVIFVKEKLNIENVYTSDLINSPPLEEITLNKWDILLLGEIIEHIDNPVMFLKNLNDKYGSSVGSLIVTAPNAFRYKNAKVFMNKEEYINSDHRYWLTPYTLAKIGVEAGWNPVRFEYADGTRFPMRLFYQMFPVLGDTIIMIFTPRANDL